MKKEYKNRILKYFLEQKAYEILNVVGYLLVGYMIFVGLPMALGLGIGDSYSKLCGNSWVIIEECSLISIWFEGAFYLVMVSLFFWIIFGWFKSNWEEATEKVEEEIKKRKRRK